MRSQDLRGHNRNPRPASPGSTTEVETSHPLLSCTCMVPEGEQLAKPKYAHNASGPGSRPGGMIAVMRNPRGRWRWPKSRPRGPTGRVGAGLKGPDLPRDEARFSSRRLGRNPPSGTPVIRKDAAPLPDGCSPLPKCGQRCGHDPAAVQGIRVMERSAGWARSTKPPARAAEPLQPRPPAANRIDVP